MCLCSASQFLLSFICVNFKPTGLCFQVEYTLRAESASSKKCPNEVTCPGLLGVLRLCLLKRGATLGLVLPVTGKEMTGKERFINGWISNKCIPLVSLK